MGAEGRAGDWRNSESRRRSRGLEECRWPEGRRVLGPAPAPSPARGGVGGALTNPPGRDGEAGVPAPGRVLATCLPRAGRGLGAGRGPRGVSEPGAEPRHFASVCCCPAATRCRRREGGCGVRRPSVTRPWPPPPPPRPSAGAPARRSRARARARAVGRLRAQERAVACGLGQSQASRAESPPDPYARRGRVRVARRSETSALNRTSLARPQSPTGLRRAPAPPACSFRDQSPHRPQRGGSPVGPQGGRSERRSP